MQDVTTDRNKHIGASDIPIIMELSPFTSRYELLQEKVGLREHETIDNAYTNYGVLMESKIRDFINANTEDKFIETEHRTGVLNNTLEKVLHTDGENSQAILEIKTTSHIKEKIDDYKIYLVQLLYELNETKKEKGVLAIYERPTNFNEELEEKRLQIYEINKSEYEELTKEIYKELDKFIEDVSRLKENPLLTSVDFMNEQEDLIKIATDIIELQREIENPIKRIDELKKELITKMNYYEKKNIIVNETRFTLTNRTEDTEILKFNEEKFKEENENIYNKYLEKVIKKGRASYITQTKNYGKDK